MSTSRSAALVAGVTLLFFLVATSLRGADSSQGEDLRVRGEFVRTSIFSGELLTVDFLSVTLPSLWNSSEVAISYLVPEGSAVEEGDVLMQLDETDLLQRQLQYETQVEDARTALARKEAELEADLQDLRLDLATAERNLKQASLYADIDPHLLSSQEAQQYAFDLDQARIAFQKVEERIASHERNSEHQLRLARLDLEKAQLELARLNSEKAKFTVHAPIPGVAIYAKNPASGSKVQVGDVLWQGLPVLFIPDTSAFRVLTYVYDPDLPFLSEGMEAEVVLDAHPDWKLHGRVGPLPRLSEPRERGQSLNAFQVNVYLEEAEPLKMKPGMSARVILRRPEQDVLAVPRISLSSGSGGESWVALRNNPDVRVPVEIIDANDRWVKVAGELQVGQELLSSTPATEEHPARQTDWMVVRRQDLVFSVTGTGTLEAERSSSFGPPALRNFWEFKIADMALEGSMVEAGDMLIRFDDSQARTRLAEEKADLEKIRRENAKTRADLELSIQDINLALEEGAVAKQRAQTRLAQARQFETLLKVRSAEFDSELAEARVRLLEKKLSSVKRNVDLQLGILADRERLHRERIGWFSGAIDSLTIRAPAPGIVLYKGNLQQQKKRVGSAVYPKEIVMMLPDLTSLVAVGRVAEIDAGKLQVGQAVDITLDALPGQKLRGRLKEIGQLLTRASFRSPVKVVDIKIELAESDIKRLRPGMATRLQVITEKYENALAVPLPALEREGDACYVWVATERGRERRRVELGDDNGVVALIRSGLEENEKILASTSK